MKFGLAFYEASGPCLVRAAGNDNSLEAAAIQNATAIAAGHAFIIFLQGAYPINFLNAVQQCPEVCRIYCASAKPIEVIIGSTDQGRGILGVVDGFAPKGVEGPEDVQKRQDFLRQIGYKL